MNKKQSLTLTELEARREYRWINHQKEMKQKVENTNKEYMSMEVQAPFIVISHSNFRFDLDTLTVEIIPLLKSLFHFFQTEQRTTREKGKANKSVVS